MDAVDAELYVSEAGCRADACVWMAGDAEFCVLETGNAQPCDWLYESDTELCVEMTSVVNPYFLDVGGVESGGAMAGYEEPCVLGVDLGLGWKAHREGTKVH